MKFLWQQIPNPVVSEILCQNKKFNGVVLDLEHASFNYETISLCIQVITLSGKKCFARLPYVEKTLIKYCLDSGVDGLIFSTVETIEDAKLIHSLCHYPDNIIKCRKRGYGFCRGNLWNNKNQSDPVIVWQIETCEGLNMIKDYWRLLKKHDLRDPKELNDMYWADIMPDFVFIGPYDLSASLGCRGEFDNPTYAQEINSLVKIVGKEQLGIHIVSDFENQFARYKDYGFVAFGLDTTMILDGMNDITEVIENES